MLGDQGLGTAIFQDHPMRADLGCWIAQARAGAGGIGHARVMQHDQFGALAAPVAMIGAGETSAHNGGWSPVRMEGGTITTGASGLCTGAAGAIAGLTTRTRSTPMVAGIGTGLRPAISAPVGA